MSLTKTARRRTVFRCRFTTIGFACLLCLGSLELPAAEFPPELVEFEPYAENPIFTGAGPGHWDVKIRERGWIRREADGYVMWYTGYDGDKAAIKLLGYATSADGLHWTRFAGNPLVRDHWVEDMMVVKQGSTYTMVAEGRSDIAQLLTSSDKLHWELRGSLDVRRADGSPIGAGPYGTPALWFEKDVWYLFYERGDRGVWLAKSTDTKVWTNVSDEPVLGLGPEAYDKFAIALNQVVKYQGRYYAYYHAADALPWKRWSTNIATSTDLVHWEKYARNPIVVNNESSALLIDDGERFRLYTMHDQVRVRFSRVKPPARLEP